MSQALLSRFAEERASIQELIEETLLKPEVENRDLTEEENTLLDESKARLESVERQIEKIGGIMDARDGAKDLHHLLARQQVEQSNTRAVDRPEGKGIGSFVDSQELRSWNGGTSARYELNDVGTDLMQRAVISTTAPPGSALIPDKPKIMDMVPQSFSPLIDAVGKLNVTTNAVDLVVYGDPKGAKTFATVAEGAAKPEVAVTASTRTVNVETVAGWVQVTRQLLQDAPAARGWIETELARGLRTQIEANILAAINAATIPDTAGASGQTLLEVARQGIATLQASGWTGTPSLLVSPAQAAAFDIELMKANNSAGAVANQSTWGLQIIPVSGLTKPILGDLQTGVTLVQRTGTEIFVSDSHAATFISNVFTILCETRQKPVVGRPSALTTLTTKP